MKRSVKCTCIAIVCFTALFFIITSLFHLPLRGEKNLSTEENENTGNSVGYISDLNTVKQSLFFHEPVRLHSMDVLATNYGNTAAIPELTYSVVDHAKQTLYSSTIPTNTITDNSYLHIELGDVKLKANQRYFLCFQGVAESESVVCPSFYMMQKDDISDYLYLGDSLAPDTALCASYHYDILPMGTNAIIFFAALLAVMIIVANLKAGDIIRQNLWTIPAGIWLLLWGTMLLSVIFINHPENKWIPHDKAGIFALSLLASSVIGTALYQNLSAQKILKKIGEIAYKYRLFFGILFFSTIFILQYILAGNLYQKIGWDVVSVWETATDWLDSKESRYNNYLEIYPNNIGISLVIYYLRLFVKNWDIAKQYHFIVIINVLLIDFAIFMTYKTAKKIWGFSIGVIAMTGLTLLFGFSGWLIVPYTDTMILWIPITIIYLFLLAEEKGQSNKIRYCSLFAIGFLTIWGYHLKPQCVIVVIAIIMAGLYHLLHLKKKKIKSQLKKYSMKIILCSIGATAGIILFSLCTNTVMPKRISKNNAISMSHFFMMGLNEHPRNYRPGGYSYIDVCITTAQKSKKEKSKKNWEISKERLKDFGVAGFLNHLHRKGMWILGDGTFYWLHEGRFFLEDYSQNGSEFQQTLRERYYNSMYLPDSDNVKHTEFMGVFEGFWLIIFGLFTMMPLLMGRNLEENELILCLSALGCIMFTLLFEGRSRYLILYLPVYSMLAAASLHKIIALIAKIKKRKTDIETGK